MMGLRLQIWCKNPGEVAPGHRKLCPPSSLAVLTLTLSAPPHAREGERHLLDPVSYSPTSNWDPAEWCFEVKQMLSAGRFPPPPLDRACNSDPCSFLRGSFCFVHCFHIY